MTGNKTTSVPPVPVNMPFTSGFTIGTQPPLGRTRSLLRVARVTGFDTAWTIDHFLGFFPRVIWDDEFSWLAASGHSPHAFFDYQTLLGYLATRVGGMRLAVGVTEPVRRHPVLIAQAFMTLAHMTKRAPILGIGAGEAENIEPYGLDFSQPVGRLEEALQLIRMCLVSDGPVDFDGEYYKLDRAVMDLRPPSHRVPEIWVAAHGPRMLRLTGTYGDGWYPTFPVSPAEYGEAFVVIRAAAQAAGRGSAPIVAGWQSFAVLGRTEAAARRLLDAKGVRFTALLAPARFWSQRGLDHPLGSDFRGMIDFVPQRYAKPELEAAIAAVPVDVMADMAMWGTPTVVARKYQEYVDAGLRHLVIQPVSGLVSKSDALFSLRAMVSIQRRLRRYARTGEPGWGR